jgi:hypothetical protein
VHDGQHPAIIDQATWDGVQAQLASNTSARTSRRLASAHLLIGRIRDEAGRAISPTHAQKGSTSYRQEDLVGQERQRVVGKRKTLTRGAVPPYRNAQCEVQVAQGSMVSAQT